MSSYKYELIIIISNQGHTDKIMETAKENGARGGTVIHGRSATNEEAVKFFGIKIQPEKELLLIVTTKDKKTNIMKAVSDKHGLSTDTKALCFSVPVSDIVGFNF
ncbi:MAG TPA: P-II family nitrogen regulator [Acholeplasmataceae bacterium]|jgi:galactokinase/mevalonate kinase-like predicted kinase|nr:P-II family nitrogen regulator [Acholeplasmataceae bacterium]